MERFGRDVAVPVLTGALASPGRLQRTEAALALGAMGECVGLDQLIECIDGWRFINNCAEFDRPAQRAVEVPARLGDERAVDPLVRMLDGALLSLAGIPPTAGFIGKYFLCSAASQQGWTLLAVALLTLQT